MPLPAVCATVELAFFGFAAVVLHIAICFQTGPFVPESGTLCTAECSGCAILLEAFGDLVCYGMEARLGAIWKKNWCKKVFI
jgi:hypothetical protein